MGNQGSCRGGPAAGGVNAIDAAQILVVNVLRGVPTRGKGKVQRLMPSVRISPRPRPPCRVAPLQRLVKDCEEKAEAAKRPSQQAPAPGAPTGAHRRAPAPSASSSGSEEDSEDSADGDAAAAPAAVAAASAAAAVSGASSGAGSSDEGTAGDSGSGGDGFVPNLDKLKKLGKRAGPGESGAARASQQRRGGKAQKRAQQAAAAQGGSAAQALQVSRLMPSVGPVSCRLHRHCPSFPRCAGGKLARHAAEKAEEAPGKKKPAAKKGKQARVWEDGGAGGKGECLGSRGSGCASSGLKQGMGRTGSGSAVQRARQALPAHDGCSCETVPPIACSAAC